MPVATAVKPKIASAFPAAEVEASLREELYEAVAIEASIRGISVPRAPHELAKLSIQIDSLVVVDLLCAVEPILDFELRERIVRAGGYRSIDTAVSHLLPRIEREWVKKNGGKS